MLLPNGSSLVTYVLERSALVSSGGLRLSLVFDLIEGAVGGGDICALAEVGGLVDGAAFAVGVKIA